MVFGNRYKLNTANSQSMIDLDSKQFTRVNDYSYLGITFDSELKFEKAPADTLRQLGHEIYSLLIIRKDLTMNCAILLYKTMILPIIDYCNFCLTSCTDRARMRLQRMQNRALRICLKAEGGTRISDLHTRAKLAPLDLHREFDILKLFHKKVYARNHENCDYTNVMLDYYQQSDIPLTRSHEAPLIQISRPNNEKFRKSLLYTGTTLWNNLPLDLRNNADYNSFRSLLRGATYFSFLSNHNIVELGSLY